MYCIKFLINIFVHLNNIKLLFDLIIDSHKQKSKKLSKYVWWSKWPYASTNVIKSCIPIDVNFWATVHRLWTVMHITLTLVFGSSAIYEEKIDNEFPPIKIFLHFTHKDIGLLAHVDIFDTNVPPWSSSPLRTLTTKLVLMINASQCLNTNVNFSMLTVLKANIFGGQVYPSPWFKH